MHTKSVCNFHCNVTSNETKDLALIVDYRANKSALTEDVEQKYPLHISFDNIPKLFCLICSSALVETERLLP